MAKNYLIIQPDDTIICVAQFTNEAPAALVAALKGARYKIVPVEPERALRALREIIDRPVTRLHGFEPVAGDTEDHAHDADDYLTSGSAGGGRTRRLIEGREE